MGDSMLPTKVDSHVYLGNLCNAKCVSNLIDLGITRVITIDIQPLYSNSHQHIEYLFIKANDNPYEDLISYFEECFEFMNGGGDGKVLVHCVAGMSRSATMVVAYLMMKNHITVEEAISYVKAKRNIAPNEGFLQQLHLFYSMGIKLDSNNLKYRQFLLKNLQYKMKSIRPWSYHQTQTNHNMQSLSSPSVVHNTDESPLQDYFKNLHKFAISNVPQKHEETFKCKKCRLFLFKYLNVIHTLNETHDENSTQCPIIFIEPLEWMIISIKESEVGQINCPNCFTKLGGFDWNGFTCKCRSHANIKSIMFKIDAKKVDFHSTNVC